MKKAIAFVLILTVILGLAACGAVNETKESKSLYAHGLDVISMLSEMTRSENFIGIYTANSEIKDIILALGDHSYETPDAVYNAQRYENNTPYFTFSFFVSCVFLIQHFKLFCHLFYHVRISIGLYVLSQKNTDSGIQYFGKFDQHIRVGNRQSLFPF